MTTTKVVSAVLVVGDTTQDVVIGGTEPQSDTDSGGTSRVPKDVSVKSESTNTAGLLKATILNPATAGDPVELQIQGEPVHTGTVAKVERGTGDRRRITSFDVSHQLKQTFISVNFDAIRAGAAIEEITGEVGIGVNIRTTLPQRITTTFKEKRADQIIEKLTKLTDTVSFVSVDNQLVIADPESVGDASALTRIIDVSAGQRRPQYQSVQVVGDTSTAERGLEARHLISSQPALAQAGEGEPTFLYKDDSIASQEQARNTAQALLRKLQKQQRGGFATIVGRPELRPFDIVSLPPVQGGSEFRVGSVEHTISNRGGFQTRLTLNGDVS
jgi:hypothetical protein